MLCFSSSFGVLFVIILDNSSAALGSAKYILLETSPSPKDPFEMD